MKKRNPTATLVLGLTFAIAIDIALRLEFFPPLGFATGIDSAAASVPDHENTGATIITPDSPAFTDYPEYPIEHGRTRLNHVGIIVEDLERSIEFYTRQFGFKLIRKAHAEGSSWYLAFLTTGAGEAILELQQYLDKSDESPPTGISHIGVFVSDPNSFYETSLAEGATWEGSLFQTQNGLMGFMIDPDGYRVEVMENPRGNCRHCHRGPHLP